MSNLTAPVETKPALRSELARYCFDCEPSEQTKRLAYANSICFCFLVLAVVGLRTPVLRFEPPAAAPVHIPVVFQPPPVLEQKPLAVAPELTQPDAMPALEAPPVVPVYVAPANEALFSVPVEGPTVLTPVQYAQPPPAAQPKTNPGQAVAAQPVEFQASTAVGGYYPEPDYPRSAIRRRMEGKVMIYVLVNERGAAEEAQVRDSSGWPLLDEHALQWVKEKWQWPAGAVRHYLVPFKFQLK